HLAGVEDLFRLGIKDGTDALAADSDHAFIFLRGLDHGESVFGGMRHRLLAIDVFAGGTGILKDLEMVVIHGGDQDGVDVLAVENRTIVAGGGDAWIVYGFARSRVTAVVEIAYRDALNARNRERCLKVVGSTNVRSDRGTAHDVDRGNWAW